MTGIDDATGAISGAVEIIRIAKDDPEAKQAAHNLAGSLVIVTQTVKNILLPLAAVNFAVAKAQTYFNTRFEKELSAKLADIPPEDLVEPKAYIASAALQGLAFSIDEDDLREMYLKLLATAMDGREPDAAHPAFVEIIRQLSSKEIKLLSAIFVHAVNGLPIAEFRFIDATDGAWMLAHRHQVALYDDVTSEPTSDPELAIYFDNWIRLGLVSVDYNSALQPQDERYAWIQLSPVYKQLFDSAPDGYQPGWQLGVVRTTDFGQRFARAVGADTLTISAIEPTSGS